MRCREIEEMLPRLIDESAGHDLRRAAEVHVATCTECRLLLAIARGERAAFQPDAASDLAGLTEMILQKTSGRVCDRIEERLVDWVDGSFADGLPPEGSMGVLTDRSMDPSTDASTEAATELMLHHLEHCPRCTELAQALRELKTELPRYIEIEPDTRFVVDVLQETSRRKRRPRATGIAPAADWALAAAQTWWERTLRRPRVALELAYGGALLLVLIFGSPTRWMQDAPMFSPKTTRNQFSAAASELNQATRPLGAFLGSIKGGFLGDNTPPLSERVTALAPRVSRTVLWCRETISLADVYGARLSSELRHLDLVGAWAVFDEFKERAGELWRTRAPNPAPKTPKQGTEPSPTPVRTVERDQERINP